MSRVANGRAREKHGQRWTRLYRIWLGMVARCRNAGASGYERYGGRGITVCDAWLIFTTFKEWSEANGYMDALLIDRVNNDGNYEPNNCRWITNRANCRNKRTNRLLVAFGATKTLIEWSEDERCQVKLGTLVQRLKMGWEAEEAISAPLMKTWDRHAKHGGKK